MSTEDARLYAQQRGGTADGVSVPLRTNEYAEQLIAQGAPDYTDWTRRGIGWATMSTAAVAGLVVRPTTTAGFEIFNGNGAGSNVCLVIDRLFAFHLVSTAVNNSAGIWAAVTSAKTAPSNGNFVVRGSNGKAYTGAVIAAAGTTVTDSGWFPYGAEHIGPNAATPGGAWEAKIEGRLIVPPQCSLTLHVVSSIVGDTFTQGASWYEASITLS